MIMCGIHISDYSSVQELVLAKNACLHPYLILVYVDWQWDIFLLG
jgi:hypothetical protein